jgi:hypothetical protein
MYNFHLFNPPESPRSVYRFLVVFCFELFLSGVDLKLGGAMASSSDDKEKTPPEDDTKNFWLKEEVESEDEEEDQRSRPNTMIASIAVVTDHNKFKKSACIRTGGGVPRHTLAPWTSLSGNNPFHTLIHEHQFQRVPRSRLPSGWDIDRSNNAGKESSKNEEGWGNNSKSWDSLADRFMNHVEHNSEMIHNLSHKIDDLKDLIEKLIKDYPPPPPKE